MKVFVVLTVAACLLAVTACTKEITTGLSVDNVFRPLIAADTTVLAGIQLDALKATELYKRHERELQIPLLDASVEKVGMDPRRDLSDATVTWNGKQSLFLIRGRFEPKVVQEKLIAQGAPKSSYRKFTLFGEGPTTLALLEGSVAAVGDLQAVRGALDRQEQGKGEIPEELQERMRSLPKTDQFWMVSRGGLPFADLPMRSDAESILSNVVSYVRGATVGLGADSGLHLQGHISCVSEQGAQRVHDTLRGAVALGRLTTKDNDRDLLRLYDAVQITKDHELVHVQADLTAELVEKLITLIPKLNGRVGGPPMRAR